MEAITLDKRSMMSRQLDLVDIHAIEELKILIIGIGGIGSNVAHVAVSMGADKLWVVDPDEVAIENIFPGFYEALDISELKTVALKCRLESGYGATINEESCLLENSSFITENSDHAFDIVIVATDTLISRQNIWNRYNYLARNGFWICARMGGPESTIFTIDMKNHELVKYFDTALNNDETSNLPCGEKATAPLTKGFIPGMICSVIAAIANRNEEDIPYRQMVNMQSFMYFTYDPILLDGENDEKAD